MFEIVQSVHLNSNKEYVPPVCLQIVQVCPEDTLLFGSIVDSLYPVESFGQEKDQFVDYSFTTDNEFNHNWGE